MTKSLDIESQFSDHVKALLSAVDAGRRVHATANIAESGKPLEEHFRRLFSAALPPTISVSPGYFFNSTLDVSGQVDALFCDRSEMLQLPPAEGLDQRYVPYNCVRAMVQVKNGASCLHDAMRQIGDSIHSWREMRRRDGEFAPVSDDQSEPLALVIIGREGSESEVRKILAEAPGPQPAYVLLLEQGLLYGKDTVFRQVTDLEDANFSSQGNGGPLALLEANSDTGDIGGRLLMWVFFAVLYFLKPAGSGRAFQALIKRVELDLGVRYSKLAGIRKSQ
jgi:hypothetical protein